MSDLSFLETPVPKVFLINTETDENWEAPFNPGSLEESTSVNYNRMDIHGLSHQPLQYRNTGNKTIPLEFFISQSANDARYGIDIPNILDDKRFLESLIYPAADMDWGYHGPPTVFFSWPGNNVRMKGRITNFEVLSKSFNVNEGTVTLMVVRLDFEENLEFKRLMDEVRQYGGNRVRGMIPGENIAPGGA